MKRLLSVLLAVVLAFGAISCVSTVAVAADNYLYTDTVSELADGTSYSFYAEESGYYNFYAYSDSGAHAVIKFNDDGGVISIPAGEYVSGTQWLEAGTTVTISHTCLDGVTSAYIVFDDEDGKSDFAGNFGEAVGAEDISLNTEYVYPSSGKYFTLTAPKSGWYRFNSIKGTDSAIDIYTDDVDQYFDDGNNGADFDGSIYLEEGDTITGNPYDCNDNEDVCFVATYSAEYEPEVYYNDYTYVSDDYFMAEVVSDTECVIIDLNVSLTELTVPAQIKGYNVVGIDSWIWEYNTKVLNLPSTINSLDSYNFRFWTSLQKINVVKANKNYKSKNGVVYNYAMTDIVVVPQNFRGSLYIPAEVTHLNDNVLESFSSASGVTIAEGNKSFVVKDDILYNSACTYLIKAFSTPENYVMKSTVKKVAESAFAGNKTMKSAKISSKVTELAYYTFAKCSALETVVLPKSLVSIGRESFQSCKKLKSVNLNNGLKEIGDCAFENTAVTKVVLPDTLKTLESMAFNNCKKLSDVTIGSGLKTLSSSFTNCTALTQIDIPSNIKNIYGTFSSSGIKKVTIPKSVTEMHNAFMDCKKLEKVTFANGFNGRLFYAFEGCVNLSDVNFPKTATEISYNTFKGCKDLYDFGIPSTLYNVDGNAFNDTGWYNSQPNGVLYYEHILYGYKKPANNNKMYKGYNLKIKDGTKSIASSAFENQTGITAVNIPDTMKYIGDYAFYGCNRLAKIRIPASVKYIGDLSIGYVVDKYGDLKVNKDFIIYGKTGTKAEKYAKENGIKFVVCKHKKSKWVIDKKATVNAAGKKHKECTVCGETVETAKIKQIRCDAPIIKEIENTSSGVKISWGKVSGADKYKVFRSRKKDSGYDYIGSTAKRYFTDKKAKSGTKYYYKIKAVNESGDSYSSKAASKYYLADPTLKTPTSTQKGITLKWSKVTGAQCYVIYRKAGSGDYKKLNTEKGVSNLSFTDKTAKKGKKYSYKVRAYGDKTYSAYSNGKSIKDKY